MYGALYVRKSHLLPLPRTKQTKPGVTSPSCTVDIHALVLMDEVTCSAPWTAQWRCKCSAPQTQTFNCLAFEGASQVANCVVLQSAGTESVCRPNVFTEGFTFLPSILEVSSSYLGLNTELFAVFVSLSAHILKCFITGHKYFLVFLACSLFYHVVYIV